MKPAAEANSGAITAHSPWTTAIESLGEGRPAPAGGSRARPSGRCTRCSPGAPATQVQPAESKTKPETVDRYLCRMHERPHNGVTRRGKGSAARLSSSACRSAVVPRFEDARLEPTPCLKTKTCSIKSSRGPCAYSRQTGTVGS